MTPARYSLPSIVLRWAMALVILLAWAGMQLAGMPPRGAGKAFLAGAHALFGLGVLALLLPRILARLLGPAPGAAEGTPAWEARLALAAYLLLYALMVALPLSGIATALTGRPPFDILGLLTIPNAFAGTGLRRTVKEAHELLANGMLAAVALHVAATLWHAFVRRDDVAARMMPRLGRRATG